MLKFQQMVQDLGSVTSMYLPISKFTKDHIRITTKFKFKIKSNVNNIWITVNFIQLQDRNELKPIGFEFSRQIN